MTLRCSPLLGCSCSLTLNFQTVQYLYLPVRFWENLGTRSGGFDLVGKASKVWPNAERGQTVLLVLFFFFFHMFLNLSASMIPEAHPQLREVPPAALLSVKSLVEDLSAPTETLCLWRQLQIHGLLIPRDPEPLQHSVPSPVCSSSVLWLHSPWAEQGAGLAHLYAFMHPGVRCRWSQEKVGLCIHPVKMRYGERPP